MRLPAVFLALSIAALSSTALADILYLNNGQKFEGKVVIEGDKVILISESGSRMSFPAKSVNRIERGPAPWEAYATKAGKLAANDLKGHLALAKWCRLKRLRKRMKLELETVIKLDPNQAEAHKLLGHQKVGDKWMTSAEAKEAKGYKLVKGKWLSPKELAILKYKDARQEAINAERKRLLALASNDKEEAEKARQHYVKLGKASLKNLFWGLLNLKNSNARIEAVKLINKLEPVGKSFSLWITQAAVRETNKKCIILICKGIKKRNDITSMTLLVRSAASRNILQRRAAYCLGLINDKRCYKALIGCLAGQPKNTIPGKTSSSSSNLTSMGTWTNHRGRGGAVATGSQEVVPAADSLEFITGLSYKNDVDKWLKWLESLDKAPGGAVIGKPDKN
jgi:uncharacterized protein YnzC (UPF0291/DUF896 family)